MVRRATFVDYPEIKEMSKKFLDQTEYQKHSDESKIDSMILNFLCSDGTDKIVFISEEGGWLAGFIAPFTFGLENMAVEFGWWVEPSKRGLKIGTELKDAFETWAKEQGCSLITMICLDDNIGKLYEKWGYKLYERTYMKEI